MPKECKCKRHPGQNFKCDFAEVKATSTVQRLHPHYLDVVLGRRIWKIFTTFQRHFSIHSFGCSTFALRAWGQNNSCLISGHWQSKITTFAKYKENNIEQVLAKFVPKVLNSSLWKDLMEQRAFCTACWYFLQINLNWHSASKAEKY